MSGRILISFFILLLAISLPAIGLALDEPGKKAGDLAGSYVNNKYGTKTDIDTKVKQPITDSAVQLTTLDGTKSGGTSVMCGQGDVKYEGTLLRVTLNVPGTVPANVVTVTVETDTNNDGVLDSTVSRQAEKVCHDGIYYSSQYYSYGVDYNGRSFLVWRPSLTGCISGAAATPAYIGGAISSKYAAASGKTITGSKATGTQITYYGGSVKDCNNAPKDISSTKYYDNPYLMDSDATTRISTCSDPSDPSCAAYTGVQQGTANATNSTAGASIVGCSADRGVSDSTSPENGKICEPNTVYYASGYSDTNRYCMTGTRWDYSSKVVLRCDPFGKSLKAEGWASWEGAPCGSKSDWPPPNQVSQEVSYSAQGDRSLGQFSVNYREGGPNTASNDLSTDITCYSTVHPLNLHMQSQCAGDLSYCDYTFMVDNAPACASFSIRVTPPIAEMIMDGCQFYEDNLTCKIKNEYYRDINYNSIQTISDGAPTHNPTPDTCKVLTNHGSICRNWWQRYREYYCDGSYQKYAPDVDGRPAQVAGSTALASNNVTYTSPECTDPDKCKAALWDTTTTTPPDCEVSCLVKSSAGAQQKGNSTFNYEVKTCQLTGSTQTCPTVTGETVIKDCGCLDNSGQAVGVLGAIYETTRDRTCEN